MLPDSAGDVVPRRSNLPKDHLRVPDANQDFRPPPPPPHHRHSTYSQDNDLSDTVANFVDFVKEGRRHHHRYRHNMHTRYRGNSSVFADFQFKITFIVDLIGSWSTSSSPVRSPSPRDSNAGLNGFYGTTSLQQRSRSPSPSQSKSNHFKGELELEIHNNNYNYYWELNKYSPAFFLDYQQSYQVLNARRSRGRILPATPNKPSILKIPDTDVKFPELNRTPARHVSKETRNVLSQF